MTSGPTETEAAETRREFAVALRPFREAYPLAVVQIAARADRGAGIWVVAPGLPVRLAQRSEAFWSLFPDCEDLERRVRGRLLLTPEEARDRAFLTVEVPGDGRKVRAGGNGFVQRETEGGHDIYGVGFWSGSPDGPFLASVGIDCPPGWFLPDPPNDDLLFADRPDRADFAFDLTERLLDEDGHCREFPTVDAAIAAALEEGGRRVERSRRTAQPLPASAGATDGSPIGPPLAAA